MSTFATAVSTFCCNRLIAYAFVGPMVRCGRAEDDPIHDPLGSADCYDLHPFDPTPVGEVTMRKVGFTGTRNGMTAEQIGTVAELTVDYDEVHHGDCVGADLDMHYIAKANGQRVVVHPPEDSRLRAGLTGDVIAPVKPYHDRNRDIVNETDALFATPAETTEQPKGGTWYTVRYAREQGKPVTIVWPDGTTSGEG